MLNVCHKMAYFDVTFFSIVLVVEVSSFKDSLTFRFIKLFVLLRKHNMLIYFIQFRNIHALF